MNKKLCILIFSVFSGLTMFSQKTDYWKKTSNANVSGLNKHVQRDNFPIEFELFQLDLEAITTNLKTIVDSPGASIVLSIPNTLGKLEEFTVTESSNFMPDLQAQYPNIRAFVGVGVQDTSAQLRLSISPEGVQGMVFRGDKENEFFETYSADNTVYAVYNSSRQKGKLPWTCSTDDKKLADNISPKNGLDIRANNSSYKTMRLAISCTAEYSNYFGATSAAQSGLVVAEFNNSMARVNGVFEKDLALKLLLVAQTTNVIYYVPASDPYSDATVGTDSANSNNSLGWNIQLQNTLNTSLTGPTTSLADNNAAYDIGHVFGASGGGGNAGCIGCVCVNPTANGQKQKGSAFTSPGNNVPKGDAFDIDYVAHEMGHQLGGNHTFSHSFENNSVNVEPGSGSTIMGYAGITGALTDVQPNSDDYFVYASILQIQNNLNTKACPVSTAVTHGTPVVTITNPTASRIIPFGTPFFLTGSATDTGGGTLTYCWEQNNDKTDIVSPLNPNNPTAAEQTQVAEESLPDPYRAEGANFRSFKPVTNGTRYFPSLASLASGAPNKWEVLYDIARVANFTLTVRDNATGNQGGQTQTATRQITIDGTRGPLTVTSQATATTIIYPVASTQTVTWTVNGTNASVGGANVDILLSVDGGLTYPHTLITATANDGSQAVTLPAGVSGAYCFFMVRANASIFFNINTKAFAIGNYTYQNVCTNYPIEINQAIVQNAAQFTVYEVSINDSYVVTDANIKVELTHPITNEILMAVRSPNSDDNKTIFNGGGCGTANMNVLFDEEGANFSCALLNSNAGLKTSSSVFPTPLSSQTDNLSVKGTWRFLITDRTINANSGIMQRAVFNICGIAPVLSTENFELEGFSLYPNPNNGNFTVKFSNALSANTSVVVYDMSGRTILTKQFANDGNFNQDINLNSVQAGVYLVSVTDGGRKVVKRIVVE